MNSIGIIGGNLCSLLAMFTDSYSSTRKTAKEVLLVQSLSQLIYCIGTILLKGYSGAVQKAVSLVRNLVAIKKIESKFIEWLLVILGVALGIWFNNLGFVGYLPVIANLQYTLSVFKFKDNERALKISFMICMILFVCFNLVILNLVGAAANLVVLVTTAFMLFKQK